MIDGNGRTLGLRAARATVVCAALLAALALLAACVSDKPTGRLPVSITGTVLGANGPAAGAIVQLQGSANQTVAAADGSFTLHGTGLGGANTVTVTAWAQDHFIGWQAVNPGDAVGKSFQITLKPLFDKDNHQYTWFEEKGVTGSAACGMCHREYKEWQADAHSQSAVNPRFVTLYRGTNIQGKKGQLTNLIAMDKAAPLDPALPHFGPGFKLDNPTRAGTCAACHAPLAGKTPTTNSCAWSGCHTDVSAEHARATGQDIQGVGPVGIEGVALEGITCEFCHAISGVTFVPGTKMPPADQPGIMSLSLLRPPQGEKMFFGTLVDSSRGVGYSGLEKKSDFCAACHFGQFGGVVSNMKMTGGTVIYNSYGEWLDSPYSDPKTGKTCQDCHMKPRDTLYTVAPELGGVARDYVAYHDHTMLGINSTALMWNAVTMTGTASTGGGALRVNVSVTNDKTGHAVPTDAPMRSVMLLVEARDAAGVVLPLKQGPALPAWTGDYAGRPGKAYAKILRDEWSGEMPTAAFWRTTTVVSDTRIMPLSADASEYVFESAGPGPATVTIKLVYRRAFQALAREKGWTDPDMVMAESTLPIQNSASP